MTTLKTSTLGEAVVSPVFRSFSVFQSADGKYLARIRYVKQITVSGVVLSEQELPDLELGDIELKAAEGFAATYEAIKAASRAALVARFPEFAG